MGCVYQLASAEALVAELVDIERSAGPVENKFGEQLDGHRRVHEAVTGEAAGAQEALNLGLAQYRVFIGGHFIESRPCPCNGRICQGRAAPASFLPDLCNERFV